MMKMWESISAAPHLHLHHKQDDYGKGQSKGCLTQEANVSSGGPVGMWPLWDTGVICFPEHLRAWSVISVHKDASVVDYYGSAGLRVIYGDFLRPKPLSDSGWGLTGPVFVKQKDFAVLLDYTFVLCIKGAVSDFGKRFGKLWDTASRIQHP